MKTKLKTIIAKCKTPQKILSRTPDYYTARLGVKKGYLSVDNGVFSITDKGRDYLEEKVKGTKKAPKLKSVLTRAEKGFVSTTEESRIVSYAQKCGWLDSTVVKGSGKRYQYTLTKSGRKKLDSLP